MSENNTPQDFPYTFDAGACRICRGQCCRGVRGYIWINEEELNAIAGAKGMKASAFSRRYIRRVRGRLSLKEVVVNGEHLCCFFDYGDRRCTIYDHRPRQCRTFPFWDQYKKDPAPLLRECPGVFLK